MRDIVPIPSPEAAHQHCDEYRRRIAELLQGGLPVPSNPEHATAIRMLIQYADLQITRVALWADGPVDLLAYVTRNFLEWSLWCKYLSEAPTNIDTLMNDAGVDVMDLIRGNPALDPTLYAIVFPPDDTKGPVYKAALERMQDAASAVLKTYEAESGPLPKRVTGRGSRNEIEKLVFKMCSKLVHPTSVSILLLPQFNEAQLEAKRVHLRSAALYYANTGLDALLAMPILH